jgi:hypothetical protein
MRWAAILLVLGGCGGARPGSDDGGAVDFGKPTLEVTIGGVHAGPAAPDASSGARLRTVRDSLGRATQSTLTIAASSTAAGASCAIAVGRYGMDVLPVSVGAWELKSQTLSGSADGTVAPIGAPTASSALGSFACSGNACDGAVLQIVWLDANHIEGFFLGALGNGAGVTEVVCSFYLPTLEYAP